MPQQMRPFMQTIPLKGGTRFGWRHHCSIYLNHNSVRSIIHWTGPSFKYISVSATGYNLTLLLLAGKRFTHNRPALTKLRARARHLKRAKGVRTHTRPDLTSNVESSMLWMLDSITSQFS